MSENPTNNHNLNRPPTGSQTGTDDVNWGDELNSNATKLDSLLWVRDTEVNMSNHEPYVNALLYATDTETVYIGDGNNWIEQEWLSPRTSTTQTGAYTASVNETVLCDASGAAFTVTLPPVDDSTHVTVKKTDSSANAVTVDSPNSETIDGASSVSLASQYDTVTITSDGTNYFEV